MVQLTRWIVALTVITTFAAVGASIFTGLQWRENVAAGAQIDQQIKIARRQSASALLSALALKKQAELAVAQVGVAKQQADSAKEQVAVSAASARALERQVGVTERQLDVLSAQAKLSERKIRQEARSLRIFIRSIQKVVLGSVPFGDFVVANDGAMPVTIRSIVYGLTLDLGDDPHQAAAERIAQFRETAKRPESKVQIVLEGGQSWERSHRNSSAPYDEEFLRRMNAGRLRVLVVVYVQYEDGLGNLHNSYACGYRDEPLEETIHLCTTPPND